MNIWANLHPYGICIITYVWHFPLTSLTNSTTMDLIYEEYAKELEPEFLVAVYLKDNQCPKS
jgi:hypothetical protein